MRGGELHVANDVVDFELAARHAAATTALGLERRRPATALMYWACGHHDDEFLVVDEVFDRHLAVVVGDLAHAWRGELVADGGDLFLDDVVQPLGAGEDVLEVLDAGADVVELGLEVDAATGG